MAAKYRKVDPRIWDDEKFIRLNPEEKLIFIYCITGPQTNRCGIYVLSLAMAAEKIGNVPETFAKRFANVVSIFNWGWDEDVRVVYLPTWWKYNTPENPNVLRGCLSDLDDLPQTPLLDRFCANLRYLPETLHPTFAERYPKRLANQEQEQEQEQEQDTPLPPKGGLKSFCPEKYPLPESLQTPDFIEAIGHWFTYCRESNRPIRSERQLKHKLLELATMGPALAVEAINASIANGWKSIYLPNKSGKKPIGTRQGESQEERFARIRRERGIR